MSRKSVKKALVKGAIRLNSNVCEGGRWLKEGDVITVIDLNLKPPKTYRLAIPVIYEDEAIAVIDKPAGISVSGNQFRTVVNALPYNLKPSSEKDYLNWPLPVHRLDNPTSGLLIVAKTKSARIKLGQAFEQQLILKKYHAIVHGEPPQEGNINNPIEGKLATSNYTKINSVYSLKNKQLSLIELEPQTGRTHQLRIHCSKIGHPILGDVLYGEEGNVLKYKGLFLAAVYLSFKHPTTNNRVEINIPTPAKFIKRLENESRRFNKYTPL